MSERTASEIRTYCEAASEGPWHKNGFLPQRAYNGASQCVLVAPARIFVRSEVAIAEANLAFCVNARVDLPRVLEVAVKLREMAEFACELADDDVDWDAVNVLLDETRWLAEDTDGDE